MLKSAPKFPEKNISKNMNLKMFGGSTLPFLLTCLTFLDVTSLRSVCKEKVNEPAIFLLIFMRRAEDFGKGGLQPNIHVFKYEIFARIADEMKSPNPSLFLLLGWLCSNLQRSKIVLSLLPKSLYSMTCANTWSVNRKNRSCILFVWNKRERQIAHSDSLA